MKKPNTLQELADLYQIDQRTLYNWLKPIRQELLEMYPTKKKNLSILLPKQVKRIVELLGDYE
jgi:hypothetical protein